MCPLKLGVIGCGAVTELCHLPALRKVPLFDVSYLCDINITRAEYLKKMYGLHSARTLVEYEGILEDRKIDAVLIATPPILHAKMAIESAKAGKHIFCEKPFTMTLAEAMNVANYIKKYDVKFMIGFKERFEPENMKTKELISEGYIGSVVNMRTFFHVDIRSWPSVSKFQLHKEKGGGSLFEMGSHHIDLARWLVGEIIKVQARITSQIYKEVDDTAEVELSFQAGAKGKISVSWISKRPRLEITVQGQKGIINTRSGDVLLNLKNKAIFKHGPLSLVFDQSKTSYQLEFLDFGKCILDDLKPSPGITDAIKNQRILLAAYESSKLNKEIYV